MIHIDTSLVVLSWVVNRGLPGRSCSGFHHIDHFEPQPTSLHLCINMVSNLHPDRFIQPWLYLIRKQHSAMRIFRTLEVGMENCLPDFLFWLGTPNQPWFHHGSMFVTARSHKFVQATGNLISGMKGQDWGPRTWEDTVAARWCFVAARWFTPTWLMVNMVNVIPSPFFSSWWWSSSLSWAKPATSSIGFSPSL